MIVLFTDFGPVGPYVGQMKAVLQGEAPGMPVIDLMSDVPAFNPRAAAHLLAALMPEFPVGAVFLCVIDPGVGSGNREPLVLKVDDRWFVGPGNALFSIVAGRGRSVACWNISWRPERLSNTFHGRDIFAPIAARIAAEQSAPSDILEASDLPEWGPAADLYEIIYVDHFGNAITGIRAHTIDDGATLKSGRRAISHASTYADVPEGEAFWYENSIGLIEIAVNQGHAATHLGLRVGAAVGFMQ